MGFSGRFSIAAGIATVGRPDILVAAVEALRTQSRPVDHIVICAPTAADVADLPGDEGGLEIVLGPLGLTLQRNAILGRVADHDIIVFLDDDFLCAHSYIATVEEVFARDPDVVLATGSLFADGILGPGIAVDDASVALAALAGADAGLGIVSDVYSAYGCNMAIRLDPVRAHDLQFDERLPLYGWLEDLDFSRQMAVHGRVVQISGARGVHLGVKRGRQSGRRLGYSQVANPIYLSRKGTCSRKKALMLMSRNLTVNCVRSLMPEPYVDRRGRLIGNLRAFADLTFGRLDPAQVQRIR